MVKYKTVIFDLDGTLTDSSPGIIECCKYAIEKNGYPMLDEKQLNRFIGPPLGNSFKVAYGITDDEEVTKLVASFREKYAKSGQFDAVLYPGIVKLLQLLKSQGRTLCVATLKNRKYAPGVVDHLGISKYFDRIVGGDSDGKLTKADILKEAMEGMPLPAVLIGDSEYDAEGAVEVGIDFVAAEYGFGFEQTPSADFDPVFIAKDVFEMVDYFSEN